MVTDSHFTSDSEIAVDGGCVTEVRARCPPITELSVQSPAPLIHMMKRPLGRH